MTWHWQSLAGKCCRPYHYLADKRSTPEWLRWRVASVWWSRAAMAHKRYTLLPTTCSSAIRRYFPAYAWPSAFAIAQRESGLDTYAKNPTSSASGCFQLMSFWWDGSNAYGWVFNPFDAAENVRHAEMMWAIDGGTFCPGQWCL